MIMIHTSVGTSYTPKFNTCNTFHITMIVRHQCLKNGRWAEQKCNFLTVGGAYRKAEITGFWHLFVTEKIGSLFVSATKL